MEFDNNPWYEAFIVLKLLKDNNALHFGTPTGVLLQNATQFINNIFGTLWEVLRKSISWLHGDPKNGHLERSEMARTARLGHYVAEHQGECIIYFSKHMYVYNDEVQRFRSLEPFMLIYCDVSPWMTFDRLMSLMTDSTATLFLHPFWALLLCSLQAMQQDPKKWMKMAPRCYRGSQGDGIGQVAELLNNERLLSTKPQATNALTAEWLATRPYRKSALPKLGSFKIVETSSSTLVMDEEDVSITVSMDLGLSILALENVQDVLKNIYNSNETGLTTDEKKNKAHYTFAMPLKVV